MSSTEVVPAAVEPSEAELALAAEVKGGLGKERIAIPGLKLTQALTDEVVAGDAKAGEYLNALTGESFGSTIQFVVADYQPGYFLPAKHSGNDKSYASFGEDVVPSYWPDEYAGRPFNEIPEAEDAFRALVGAGTIEWGDGPKIARTHSFIGYVVGQEIPVRLSLQRTASKAAQKLITLLRFSRVPWDTVYELSAEQQKNSKDQPFYVPTIKQVGPASPEQQHDAVNLALAHRAGDTEDVAATPEDEPAAEKPATPSEALPV